MNFGADDNRIYVVPLLDVNWLTFAPFDPARGFRIDPPKVEQSVGETRTLCREMRDLTDGKFILSPHSGTYCRSAYYEGEMLDVYREAVKGGGELSVHLHEEIKGAGTRFGEENHIRSVFVDCRRRLEAVGIHPVAYRGGHYAYAPFMNDLLVENEIYADYSCCPGLDEPTREAIWTKSSLSAELLPENTRETWKGQKRTKILEIPIGSDGKGTKYANILHVEQSDLDNLMRIWDVIVKRAEAEGRAQLIHCLFHTGSMGRPELVERYKQFLDLIPKRHGQFVTTREAARLHDRFVAEAA